MPNSLKFPPSVEIKRAIAAAERAGIKVSSIEIHPRKITIHSRDATNGTQPMKSEYQQWKEDQQEIAKIFKAAAEKSDALPRKSRR